MVWETRQNRLKGLFGAPEELCFQVFVEVYQRTADPEKFGYGMLDQNSNLSNCESP